MLAFLRKIRRSLINSGSAQKYILYAIGEILLVMIGILLALQVNNWNEDRKNRAQEIYYLKALKEEFSGFSLGMESNIGFHQAQINRANLVLDALTEEAIDTTLEELHIALLHVGWASYTRFNKTVWEELVNTGNLELLSNPELRNTIAGFDESTDGLIRLEEEWSGFNVKYRNITQGVLPPRLRLAVGNVLGFYRAKGPVKGELLSLTEISKKLKAIKDLGGLVSDIIIVRTVSLNFLNDTSKNIKAIIDLLEEEISRVGDKTPLSGM